MAVGRSVLDWLCNEGANPVKFIVITGSRNVQNYADYIRVDRGLSDTFQMYFRFHFECFLIIGLMSNSPT